MDGNVLRASSLHSDISPSQARTMMLGFCLVEITFGFAEIVSGAVGGVNSSILGGVITGSMCCIIGVVGFIATLWRLRSGLLFYSVAANLLTMLLISATMEAVAGLLTDCDIRQVMFQGCYSLPCALADSCTKDDLGYGSGSRTGSCSAVPTELCDNKEISVSVLSLICFCSVCFWLPAGYISLIYREKLMDLYSLGLLGQRRSSSQARVEGTATPELREDDAILSGPDNDIVGDLDVSSLQPEEIIEARVSHEVQRERQRRSSQSPNLKGVQGAAGVKGTYASTSEFGDPKKNLSEIQDTEEAIQQELCMDSGGEGPSRTLPE